MTQRRFIGLSSGSSVNGVDAALVETDGVGLDLRLRCVHFLHHAYTRELRELLLRAGSANPLNSRQAAMLHRVLGETFAAAARSVAEQAKVPMASVLCIGCPGQTLWHETEGRYPATLNIGMPAVLAEHTGITTVSDFRSRDLAAGGQGLPLTPLLDYLLFNAHREHRLLINLGGVATVTSLPGEATSRTVAAFQAAPCTILIDGMMRLLTGGREHFDAWGKHAVQGCCIEPLLKRWLSHPLLQKKPPRNFSRHEFGDDFLNHGVHFARQLHRNLHDVLCTATHFTACAIVQAVQALYCQAGATGAAVRRRRAQRLALEPSRTTLRTAAARKNRRSRHSRGGAQGRRLCRLDRADHGWRAGQFAQCHRRRRCPLVGTVYPGLIGQLGALSQLDGRPNDSIDAGSRLNPR